MYEKAKRAKANGDERKDEKNLRLRAGTWYLSAQVKGARIFKSLHTGNLGEARARRDLILSSLTIFDDEKTLLKSVKRQLIGIAEEEREALSAAGDGILLAKVFDKWLADPNRHSCKEQQLDNHKRNWRAFLDWLSVKYPNVQYCRQVRPFICQEYAAFLFGKCKSNGTYNKYIQTLKVMFGCMEQYDEFLRCPVRNLHLRKESDAIPKEPFTDEELRAIFACPDEEFKRLCAIGLYTSLRLGSARALTWDRVSESLDYLTAIHDKTGADASQKIAPELREILLRVPAELREGLICPFYGKLTKYNAALAVQKNLEALGIQTHKIVQGINGQARRACIKGFHSFRHTAITRALQNGATVSQVKRWAGHASERMQARYTHLGADDAGKASAAIGRFW